MNNKNIVKLKKLTIKEEYLSLDDISAEDIALLTSKAGIKHLVKQDTFNIATINTILKDLAYEQQLRKLQVEIIKLQKYVIENQKKIIILFEGRDSAGKGGTIRRIMERANPRHISEIAFPKPSQADKSSWYFNRYVNKLPQAGHIVLFNRSWYNRAIIEPVNNFCSDTEYQNFMNDVLNFENMLMRDGCQIIKLYFSISKTEQKKRINLLSNDELSSWRLSIVDKNALSLWDKYTEYKNTMFTQTSDTNNPWAIVNSNSEISARLSAIKYILSQVDYQ